MLDRELTIAVWDRAQVFMWLKRAGRYFPYIEEKLAEAGMPGDLKYVPVAESALITNIKSRRRAVGLWQFMSRTARRYGLRKNRLIDERLDFERSTEAAIKYLDRLHSEFGNWTLALAAYNCGDASLKREIRNQKVKDFYRLDLPLETERYIFRIAAIKAIMENPVQYGFHLPPEHIYPPHWYDTVPVKISRRLKFTDLALALDTDFKALKELNPQFLRNYLPRGNYRIKVPPGFGPKVVAALQELGKGGSGQRKNISNNHYVVRAGDTLVHISQRTGVSLATLKRINGIEGSTIWAGQKLRLTP
jgi:membrane-bound lytic murein transglycosylase D